jgi:hypothetical protein
LPVSPINAIALDSSSPPLIYAGASTGVFRASGGSGTWSSVSNGIRVVSVSAVAAAPSNPAVAYAGLANGGTFRTTDGGTTWSAAGTSVIGADFLVVHPTDPNTIYGHAPQNSLMRSVNGGTTWGYAAFIGDVQGLTISPNNPSFMYAATWYSNAVFKSVDSSATWTSAKGALAGLDVYISGVAVDPTNPSLVYAVNRTVGGVYRTLDAGATWSKIGGNYADWIVVDPVSPATLYTSGSGLHSGYQTYKSTDGGITWIDLHASGMSLSLDPSNHQTVYLGTATGLQQSTNGGTTWTTMNTPFTGANVPTVTVGPTGTVWAGTSGVGAWRRPATCP